MDYDRIYEYRFRGVSTDKKQVTWDAVSRFIMRALDNPAKVIDPAAGMCEFINAAKAPEKWAIDLNGEFLARHAGEGVRTLAGDALEVSLPENYFDAAFLSNFLEHLHSPEEIQQLLTRLHAAIRPGGRIAVMGPNFKYSARSYFDFADHRVALTHLSLEEHLYSAGFTMVRVIPRFLPLSFRGRLPVNRPLVNLYLALPLLWRIFGRQFLVIAEK